MSRIGDVADGLGATIEAGSYFDEVYPLPPAVTLPRSATVLPTGGAAETYCDDELTFAVVLVAATNDYPSALEFLGGGIDAVRDALAADPDCGGVCEPVSVKSWGEFFTTSANGANVLAVRVVLTNTNAT